MSVKAHIGWIRMNKHLNVLTHTGHMESPNLVALCADGLDDTLPSFTGVQWDSVQATHGVFAEAYTVATRVASVAHVCRVVMFIPLQG
jgi:hypothetical protein